MRILGVDYGDRKIGIAMCDPMGMIAQGVETIRWDRDTMIPINRIKEIIQQHKVEKCVVGFPKNMNGTIGERGEKTNEFISILKSHIDIPIIPWDERLTTKAANRVMTELGIKTSKKKKIEDQIAAVYILQNYLDSI